MKFRRHDLEKRSGGSPVILFHHRRPPAPLPRNPPLPPRRLASSYVVCRGWNRRENINFSVPRPTYAFFPLLLLFLLLRDPSRPWDFLGHGSVIWCPTNDRSPSPPPPSTPVDHWDLRSWCFPRLWARHTPRTATLLFSGRTICPPVPTERLRLRGDFHSRHKYDYKLCLKAYAVVDNS